MLFHCAHKTRSTIALHSSTTCWRACKQQQISACHTFFYCSNRQKTQIFVLSVFKCLIQKKCIRNQLVFIQQNCSLLSRWLLIGITRLPATELCWSSRQTPKLKIRLKGERTVEKWENSELRDNINNKEYFLQLQYYSLSTW